MTCITAREDDLVWMFFDLEYARREAQQEAELAYDAWCQLPGRDGYAVYRAAQDRADAAQDELAAEVRRSVCGRSSNRRWEGRRSSSTRAGSSGGQAGSR